MWYAAHIGYNLPTGERVAYPTCYAESDDGINWRKPILNMFEFNGSTANSIVIPEGYVCGIIRNPNETDPDKRFQSLVMSKAMPRRLLRREDQRIRLG